MKTIAMAASLVLVPAFLAAQQPSASAQAKGSATVQTPGASGSANVDVGAQAQLDAAQAALVRAGRAHPRQEEVSHAAQAMAHGATAVQIEALAKHAPADRSLVASFDALSNLAAHGVPIDKAAAQIQAQLDAGATDDVIANLGAKANLSGATNPPSAAAETGAKAAVGVGRAAAGVTGAVGGVIRVP